jgi:hypothetical protein
VDTPRILKTFRLRGMSQATASIQARAPRRQFAVPTGGPPFAVAGSQRWLQIGVALAPDVLDAALRRCEAIEVDDAIRWKSPIAADQFAESRDKEVLRRLSINSLPGRSLRDFWPQRGAGMGCTRNFVEGAAHPC